MAVVLVHTGPEPYPGEFHEEIVSKLTDGKSQMELPSDWPVAGLLVHAAGQGQGGFRVVDVWESEEACNQFGGGPSADFEGGRRRRAAGDVSGAHICLGLSDRSPNFT